MWMRNIADSVNGVPRSRGRGSRLAKRQPLLLEVLEDRCLPSFNPVVSYPTGWGPEAVVTADFNNDHVRDLAVVNFGDSTVSVLLGNADGTFRPAVQSSTGSNPLSLAVGDFNGDGNLDIVTANNGDSTVSVLLGNGDGSFQAAKNYAAGSQPASVAVGNFDGKLDIVTANQGDATVSLLPGNGDGTFGAARTGASFNAPAESVAVGDFNADGKLDLAVAIRGTPGYYGWYGYYPGGPATVNVLLGNGSGTFTAASSYGLPSPYWEPPSNYGPPSVAVADLNGDDKLDLVTTNAGDNSVSVLWGNGNGTFNNATANGVGGTFSTGASPASVASADLNGDGKLDLVTANAGDSSLSVLLNQGNGAFGTAETFAVGAYPASVATGDFNGDGFPDVAVANSASNNVSVLLNAQFWPALQVTATDPHTGATITGTTAGSSFNFTVTARDPLGNVLTNYGDQVAFSNGDPLATIVDPTTGKSVPLQGFTYTFTSADHGAHTFSVDLQTAGAQVITVNDTAAGVLAYDNLNVSPAAASSFQIGGFPSPITAGNSSEFTVTAYDPYGNVATGYSGTVILGSSDTTATFADALTGSALANKSYTFSPADDYGSHIFVATLDTIGNQSISATDSANSAVTGTQSGIEVDLGATVTGPYASYIGQPLTYTLGAIGDPAGTTFTYKVDWNGDGTVDQTVTGPNGTTVMHAYSATGYAYIGVTASDSKGHTSVTAYTSINILPVSVAIQTDPAHTAQQMLTITGSPNSDSIVLGTGASNNGVTLTFDGYALGTITPTHGTQFALVIALGQGGYDTLDARALSVSSVLVGGADNDTLYGGSARNLLIGGQGADTLYAGSAGDILIGGSTSYDSNVNALAYLMAEWSRTDVSYTTRVKHLSGSLSGGLNGSYVLNSTTVFDDNTVDVLNGGAGLDWFLAHKHGKHADKLIGQVSGEVITDI